LYLSSHYPPSIPKKNENAIQIIDIIKMVFADSGFSFLITAQITNPANGTQQAHR
jgi:hypothetical protein